MYNLNNSGLESRLYSSSSPNLSYSREPTISYSKLEIAASPEIIQQDYRQVEIINMDKPLEIIRENIAGYNKSLPSYLKNTGTYSAGAQLNTNYTSNFIPKTVEVFNPNSLLNEKRTPTQFIGDTNEIKSLVSEAFMKTTGLYLPSNMTIRVCTPETMKKFHSKWDPSITGFCFNKNGFGTSEIFVLQGELDHVMLTIGHEIGHCLSKSLNDPRDEEAKAFAFSLAWAKKIKEHNIGNLAMNIDLNPAKNGIHDVALGFVFKLMKKGEEALDIYRKFAINKLRLGGENELSIKTAI